MNRRTGKKNTYSWVWMTGEGVYTM